VILFERIGSGGQIRAGRITADGLELGESIRICDHVAPPSSRQFTLGRDGRLAMLFGLNTIWVRAVDREKLMQFMFTK
jgi:hypothetical protein